ncbi:hypothetical protein ABH942_000414 [Flavobacterium sp. 28YEA47A]|uniref:hypothetical protein n=1 Tax=Flavobacterium sp. 28YEA47A TaxID=3156276 RepID=UPI00351308EC
MKLITKFSIFLLMVLGTTITSCSDDGKDGKDGLNGTNGEPGTANVIYSNWLNRPDGVEATIDGTTGMVYSYSVPQITNEILNSGAILVYLQFGSGEIFPLAYTSRAGGIVNTVEAVPSVGNLKILRYRHDGMTPAIQLGFTVKIRYIIIPGGAPVPLARQMNYKERSYEDVCESLGIPK